MIVNLDPPDQPHWLAKPRRILLRLIRGVAGPRQLRLALRDRTSRLRPRGKLTIPLRLPCDLERAVVYRRRRTRAQSGYMTCAT